MGLAGYRAGSQWVSLVSRGRRSRYASALAGSYCLASGDQLDRCWKLVVFLKIFLSPVAPLREVAPCILVHFRIFVTRCNVGSDPMALDRR